MDSKHSVTTTHFPAADVVFKVTCLVASRSGHNGFGLTQNDLVWT
jgi:hypothetical protein